MKTRLFAPLLDPPPDALLATAACFLIIEEVKDSAFLYHIDEKGHCSDNWFLSVSEAKEAAEEYYGERLGAWEDVPPEVDGYQALAAFGLARLAAIRDRNQAAPRTPL